MKAQNMDWHTYCISRVNLFNPFTNPFHREQNLKNYGFFWGDDLHLIYH